MDAAAPAAVGGDAHGGRQHFDHRGRGRRGGRGRGRGQQDANDGLGPGSAAPHGEFQRRGGRGEAEAEGPGAPPPGPHPAAGAARGGRAGRFGGRRGRFPHFGGRGAADPSGAAHEHAAMDAGVAAALLGGAPFNAGEPGASTSDAGPPDYARAPESGGSRHYRGGGGGAARGGWRGRGRAPYGVGHGHPVAGGAGGGYAVPHAEHDGSVPAAVVAGEELGSGYGVREGDAGGGPRGRGRGARGGARGAARGGAARERGAGGRAAGGAAHAAGGSEGAPGSSSSALADEAAAAADAAAAAAAAAAAGDGGDGSSSDGGDTLTCVICADEVAAVAVGACGHSHTCARCCLRLRLCLRDLRCALCKAVNEEVLVARPPVDAGRLAELLAAPPGARPACVWQQPRWARGVLVLEEEQRQPHPQRGRGGGVRPLHSSLMAMTSCHCTQCDRHGRRPFGSMGQLLAHLQSAHERYLCDVCVGAGLKFPAEHPAMTAPELGAHMSSTHPRCEYCDLSFYGPDELFAHMTQCHYTCHVCSRLGRHHLYFQSADTLQVHQHEAHHVCDHPDCYGCMIAFATQDELAAHIRDRHSAHMPRWDPSRARPLLLDFATPRGGGGGGGDRRGGGGAGGAHPRAGPGSGDAEAFPALRAEGPPQAQAARGGLGDARDAEGGLEVIDDDLGLAARGPAPRAAAPAAPHRGTGEGREAAASAALAPGAGPGVRVAGVWAGRVPGSGTFREDFPELSSAAAAAPGPRTAWAAARSGGTAAPPAPAPPGGAAWPANGGGSGGGGPALRKVTVRCGCGRRVEHLAMRPGEEPQPLRCDRACAAQQRRAQLADAFGVPAAGEGHVPYFDRHRHPTYPVSLIQAAQSLGVEWVGGVEAALAAFLADPSARRTALPVGMRTEQRRLVHELAPHYGLASHSTGQGAGRAVQLLRGPSSGVPTRSLAAVAAATPPEELARAAAAAPPSAWALRLVDVAPGAHVAHYLRPWEGEYTLTPAPASAGAAAGESLVVAFSREAAFRDAAATLAGGVRGVFRTAPMPPPPAAAPAAAAPGPDRAPARAAPPPAVAPAGWQVLRGGKTGGGKRVGAGAGGADGGAAVRAALAADAWGDSGDERPRGGGAAAAAAVRAGERADGGPGGMVMPARGPALDLREATVWSALGAEEAE